MNCRVCQKKINTGKATPGDNPYNIHICEEHPEVREWLRQERTRGKERLGFAIRAITDLPPGEYDT
jgi:hypothetical protein